MNRFDRRRFFLVVVGVELGVGKSLSLGGGIRSAAAIAADAAAVAVTIADWCNASKLDVDVVVEVLLTGVNFGMLLFSDVIASKACCDDACEIVPHLLAVNNEWLLAVSFSACK